MLLVGRTTFPTALAKDTGLLANLVGIAEVRATPDLSLSTFCKYSKHIAFDPELSPDLAVDPTDMEWLFTAFEEGALAKHLLQHILMPAVGKASDSFANELHFATSGFAMPLDKWHESISASACDTIMTIINEHSKDHLNALINLASDDEVLDAALDDGPNTLSDLWGSLRLSSALGNWKAMMNASGIQTMVDPPFMKQSGSAPMATATMYADLLCSIDTSLAFMGVLCNSIGAIRNATENKQSADTRNFSFLCAVFQDLAKKFEGFDTTLRTLEQCQGSEFFCLMTLPDLKLVATNAKEALAPLACELQVAMG